MSSPISNIWQGIVLNFKRLLEPILLGATDESARRALLASAGLDPNRATNETIIIPADAIGKIDNFIASDPNEADLEKFFEILEVILQVIDALEAFVRAIIASSGGDDEAVMDELMHFYINLLTISYFKRHAQPIYAIFEMLGVIEDQSLNLGGISAFFKDGFGYLKDLYCVEPEAGDPRSPAEIEEEQVKQLSDGTLFPLATGLTWALQKFLSTELEVGYGWDAISTSPSPLADKVLNRTLSIILRGSTKDGSGNDVRAKLLMQILLLPPVHHQSGDKIGVVFRFKGSAGLKAKLGKGFVLDIEFAGPDAIFSFPSFNNLPSSSQFELGFKITHTSGDDHKALIGDAKGTHLLFGKTGMKGKFSPEKIELKAFTEKGELVIKTDDGFIKNFMPEEGLKIKFSLAVGYSNKRGFFIEGGAGLLITLAIHKQFGPLYIETITLGGKAKVPTDESNAFLELEASAGFSLQLGAFTAVVERIGLETDLGIVQEGERGNLGPLDLGFGFKPPNGIGLSIDAKVVKGGGYLFFDPDAGFYAGAVELSVMEKVLITGIALITTKKPDGSDGFSMLVIVNVSFSPGIALGMGVFLQGLGGLLGINQTVNVEALRKGVKDNTIDHILFPENVIANISRIISDLRVIFPPRDGQFLIGFFAKLSWGAPKLFDIEFGLIVEFDSPVRIAILGVFRAVIPKKDAPILSLQVNFLGVLDFEGKYISFDASLYNSSLLAFKLEGDMALRIKWGDNGGFVLSIGGFHPSFTPPANLNIPSMKRLSLSLLSGNPRLSLSTYFAVTSNTVQFGASAEFVFKVSKFGVYGYLGFDVLFQFSPFRFIVEIRAGVEVRMGSKTLFSIALKGELQGPTPWMFRGYAKFKILFFSVKVRFCATWGQDSDEIEPAVMVAPLLEQALSEDRNWTTQLPANRELQVSLKELDREDAPMLLHGTGSLSVSQQVLPLHIGLDRLGNQPIGDIKKLEIKAVFIEDESVDAEPARDDFAPAAFKDMKDEDKLSAPSYVKEQSGIRLKDADQLLAKYAIGRKVEYEQRISDYDRRIKVDPEIRTLPNGVDEQDLFCQMAEGGAIGRSPLSIQAKLRKNRILGSAVDLSEERFALANTVDLKQFAGASFGGGSRAQADDALRQILQRQPEFRDKIAIIPAYELNTT